MKRFISFLFLMIVIFTHNFAKMQFKEKGKDSSITGYPLYTLETQNYSKQKNFLEFYEKTKEIRVKDKSSEISFLLEVPGELGYADRIDIKNNKFVIGNNQGQLFYYSEEEFLDIRIGKPKKDPLENKPKDLTGKIMNEQFYGKPGLAFRVQLNRAGTEKELKDLTKKIYKTNASSKKTFIHPATKKKMNYQEYSFFYYLPKQDTSSSAYASFIVTKNGDVKKEFIKD